MSYENNENQEFEIVENDDKPNYTQDFINVMKIFWMILFPIIYLAVCMLDGIIKFLAGAGALFAIGVLIMGLSMRSPQFIFIGMFFFIIATAIGHIKEIMDAYIEKGNKS